MMVSSGFVRSDGRSVIDQSRLMMKDHAISILRASTTNPGIQLVLGGMMANNAERIITSSLRRIRHIERTHTNPKTGGLDFSDSNYTAIDWDLQCERLRDAIEALELIEDIKRGR